MGGPEYYKAPSMLLRLSGRPLGDVVGAALAGNTPLVVVKAPVNADMKGFMGAVGNHTKHGADYQSHDVVKPKGNSKGAIAYRLVFVRALPLPVVEGAALPVVEGAALPTVEGAVVESSALPVAGDLPLTGTRAG